MSYGNDSRQRFDVYLPANPNGAPVILMVHGGAWAVGDKSADGVVQNKVAHWVARGFIFVSTNYRLVPDAMPVAQAEDVARALAVVQRKAASWGGDPEKIILMGHSAGAHLVALLTASPRMAETVGAKPWLGSVLLDSAALDVPAIMKRRHARFYDRAFGNDPIYWRSASPYHVLAKHGPPLLAVCSTRRRDDSCGPAKRFADQTTMLGRRATVLPQDKTHAEINSALGSDARYTASVDDFLRSLDPIVSKRLSAQ